ncbi:MAG TPA: universal stress protein [Usitatibacter sp.]|nr:universal stress protein [Usitatibacter sp.]
MKILLAADASDFTRRAAHHLVQHLSWFAEPPQVFVLHVHPPIPYPGAAAAAGRAAVDRYLREDSEAALRVATRELDKGKVAYEASWTTGNIAPEIAAFAKKNRVDLVVMGSHGEGALSNLVLGSVTTKLLATIKTPILVVR